MTPPKSRKTQQTLRRAPLPRMGDTRLRDLAARIAADLSARHARALPPSFVRKAVGDAEALAATTGAAELVLPELAREKVDQARSWYSRQQEILERSAFSFSA
jgi:hypothetical protein